MKIPFNKPSLIGTETEYVMKCFQGVHTAGDGEFTKNCHALLESELGVKKAMLTTSCTHALEMSALLLDLQPGDEFILPSFTFVSTANAYVLRGARPVFADIRPDTLNIDETKLENLITPLTKAIVVVHYAGVGCEMNEIMRISKKYDIPVIEDNAHGLFGKYNGQYLGTFGCMATQSFHETKNFSCGEGGALLINDPKYIERAEIIREKGTNRNRFFRGQVDKYTWVDVGSSYLPSDILAAFLYSQLKIHVDIQKNRKRIWENYNLSLQDWATENKVSLPSIPEECGQAYHMFYILLPTIEKRHQLIQYLKSKDIAAVFHYLPLHLSEMGTKLGTVNSQCPVTEDISDRLLRLPFYNTFTEEEQKYVTDSIKGWKS